MRPALGSFVTAGLWALLTASQALAQADAQVQDLNAQALEAYQALDMDTARAKAEQALGVAQQAGLRGPVVAQAFMTMAVVQVAGFSDRDQGLAAFVSALCTQPDVQLDPLLSTPDVQQTFAQAQQDAAAGACGPGGPPPPVQPQLMPQQAPMMGPTGPQVMDRECPPGVVCDGVEGDDEGPENRELARFFVNLQLVGGFAYVTSGLEADAPPPLSEVIDGRFVDINYDGYLEFYDGFDLNTVDAMNPMGRPIDRDMNGQPDGPDGVTDHIDINGDNMITDVDRIDYDLDMRPDNRFTFNDQSAWVPDKDSFDDFEDYVRDTNDMDMDGDTMEVLFDPSNGQPMVAVPRGRTPVLGNCDADGQLSGPVDTSVRDLDMQPFPTYEPTKYCVRVPKPGMVPNLALRLNPGYFITESFALSAPIRLQFDAGEGSMSNILLGLRAEVLLLEMEGATGFPIGLFFGATYGQIQAKPPRQGTGGPSPYVISGPFGAHFGVNVRFRFHRNFGVILSPEVDVQFPNLLFNVDVAAGPEVSF